MHAMVVQENVSGDKCDSCESTDRVFGDVVFDHPKGCFECFCFNRSSFCVRAQYPWQQVPLLTMSILRICM